MLILDEAAVAGRIVSVEPHGELKLCCSTKGQLVTSLCTYCFCATPLEEPLSGVSSGSSIVGGGSGTGGERGVLHLE